MNNRERVLAILDHQPPDRIPWIPRLLLWYTARNMTDSMPAKWQGLSLREVEHELGVGTPARDGRVFDVTREGVDIVEREEGGKRIVEHHTPVGMVRSVTHFSEDLDRQGLPGRVEEHLLKGPDDYRVWEWVVEHTTWTPAYDAYRAYDAEIGGDGLPMVSGGDVPFHEFAQSLAGYQDAYYQLADHPREVEHLLAVMAEVEKERLWPVIAESPVKLIVHGMHLSSQFTPPAPFEKYIVPYYEGLVPLLHESGISVAMHADNDVSQLLELTERAGWDMMECFVTAPMVPLTLERAREAWGNRVILWGALPSLMFAPSVPETDFREYMHAVLDILAPGDAVILGAADNVMPDSLIERVGWVSDLVQERGQYPIVPRASA